ncbi:hypothetical protein RclHR1_18100001 [Rhizophagus clarus]|uniref:Uncharacterized protein n=1 Tax=Rhizophagus clarus TaxID=94130 RepID=A0A2Z6QQU9_9GLOM|nr:hypothetical protein RclHR1_18100001 [Rhizophagus clarus]
MSNKILSSQPKSVLELLEVPGIKEELEEDRKKYFNLTAIKEWEEAGEPYEEEEEALCMKNEKNETYNGVNSRSVDNNTESESVDVSLPMNENIKLEIRLGYIPVKIKKPKARSNLLSRARKQQGTKSNKFKKRHSQDSRSAKCSTT